MTHKVILVLVISVLTFAGCSQNKTIEYDPIFEDLYEIAYQPTYTQIEYLENDNQYGRTFINKSLRLELANDTNSLAYMYGGKRYYFDSCFFKGISHFRVTNNIRKHTIIGVEIRNSEIDTLAVLGETDALVIDSVKAKTFFYSPNANKTDLPSLSARKLTCDALIMQGNDFSAVRIWDCNIQDKFVLSSCRLRNVLELSNTSLPDVLLLRNVDIDSGGVLRITGSKNAKEKVCHLQLENVTINGLDIEYENMKLSFQSDLSRPAKETTYRNLLDHFKRQNYERGVENLTKEFREFQHTYDGHLVGRFVNWMDRWWWDYGFNKALILWRSFILFFIFTALNFFLFEWLLKYGYKSQRFSDTNELIKKQIWWKRIPKKCAIVFMYTAHIFWGFKLEFDDLGIGNIGLFIYVVGQYVIGLACLGFIANLITTLT
ncbi:MAG: hypothetical protein QM762_26120 [Chryseolinea sp.]